MKDSGRPRRDERDFDWGLTTWEGSRREKMRRWARLTLDETIMALEEMERLLRELSPDRQENSPGNG